MAQLGSWMGRRSFTSIFSHVPGDGKLVANFLSATASMGPTFTLVSISGSAYGVPSNLPPQIIGGYNPFSWIAGTVLTPHDAQRSAFIFNLTRNTTQSQNLKGQGAADSGKFQATGGGGAVGFKFGGQDGDIMVASDLNEGWATNYSYGGTSAAAPITYGGAVSLTPPKDSFQVNQLDVYTLS
jgi:hypothetical protein